MSIDNTRWQPILGSWRRNDQFGHSQGNIFVAGGAPLQSFDLRPIGAGASVNPPNLSASEEHFAQGARLHNYDGNSIELELSVIAFGTNVTNRYTGTSTNRYLIDWDRPPHVPPAGWQWVAEISFTDSPAETIQEAESLPNAAWRGTARRDLRAVAPQNIPGVSASETRVLEGWRLYRNNHTTPSVGDSQIAIDRMNANWRDSAPLVLATNNRRAIIPVPIEIRESATWVRIGIHGRTAIAPAGDDRYAYFKFPVRDYRPMATRVGTQWHSLNRNNGFLQSRNSSGNWVDLPLLQHANAPNMNATNNTNAQTPFPSQASSQSRDASGVWRQQSLIGSE